MEGHTGGDFSLLFSLDLDTKDSLTWSICLTQSSDSGVNSTQILLHRHTQTQYVYIFVTDFTCQRDWATRNAEIGRCCADALKAPG